MLLIAVVLKVATAKLAVSTERRESPLGQRDAQIKINIARRRVHNDDAYMGSPERIRGGSAQGRRLEIKISCCTIRQSATDDGSCDRLRLSFRHRDPRNATNHR